MSTITKTKASVAQTVSLAKFLANKGLSQEQVVPWLKSQNYTVRDVTFQAVQVAFTVAGYNLAKSEEPEITAKPARKPRVKKS